MSDPVPRHTPMMNWHHFWLCLRELGAFFFFFYYFFSSKLASDLKNAWDWEVPLTRTAWAEKVNDVCQNSAFNYGSNSYLPVSTN